MPRKTAIFPAESLFFMNSGMGILQQNTAPPEICKKVSFFDTFLFYPEFPPHSATNVAAVTTVYDLSDAIMTISPPSHTITIFVVVI
jgi:hypothetical protein